jgi:hypothetical protein
LKDGGEIVFTMGAKPNTDWGVGAVPSEAPSNQ